MSVARAILLSLLAAQADSELRKADRAVVVPAKGGSRIEIKDPAVLRSLESPASADPKAPVREDPAWTLTFYSGEVAIREARVPASAGTLAALLRNLERIDPLCRDLGSDDERVRVQATRELTAIGRPALDIVKRLSETTGDAEIKFRATQIVRDIQATFRPRVHALFFFGRKEKATTAAALEVEDWVRKAALEQGFPILTGFVGAAWTEIPLTKGSLHPPVQSGKSGGVHVWGQVVESTTEDGAVVELTCSMKSWTQGKFTLDAREPRKLIRLSNQQPMDDVFVALKIEK
jgi:hypothetical protein